MRTIFLVQKRMYSPRHRNRIHFLQVSLLMAAGGLLLYLTTLPIATEIGLLVHWMGALVLVTILVNRHLPDIKTGFKELVSLTIVALFTFGLYATSIYILEVWFTHTPRARFRTALVAAIVLTLFYPPLYRLIRRLTQRLLFRHQFNYNRIIKTYIQTVNNILLVEDLTSICLSFIEKNLNIRRGAFFLLKSQDKTHYHFTVFSNLTNDLPDSISLKKDTPLTRRLVDAGESISQYTLDVVPVYRQADEVGIETLKRMAFEQFIPIKRHNFLIAILAVGPFASGAPYTLEDIELLSTMAEQTAIALENARLFKNVRYNLEEISRINDLMDNIFASIQSGVITVDTDNKITLLNPAARRIFNVPPDIRTASSADDLMHHLRSTP
ncbi:MAG: PAS domain-containing protein, partial [Caldilineae bacterium]